MGSPLHILRDRLRGAKEEGDLEEVARIEEKIIEGSLDPWTQGLLARFDREIRNLHDVYENVLLMLENEVDGAPAPGGLLEAVLATIVFFDDQRAAVKASALEDGHVAEGDSCRTPSTDDASGVLPVDGESGVLPFAQAAGK
jgi:hypothetical protein